MSATVKPSSAGECQVCGKHAEKRYGGEGRYLVMCLDCWLDGATESEQARDGAAT